MDSKYIPEVVKWIQEHPTHTWDDESFEGNSPAEMWLRFCQNPQCINEYADPQEYTMDDVGEAVEDGCSFKFTNGTFRSRECGVARIPGRNYCAFHDHVIFSKKLRDAVTAYHDEIDQICKSADEIRKWADEEGTEEVTEEQAMRYPPQMALATDPMTKPGKFRLEKLRVLRYIDGWYREVKRNLIVHGGIGFVWCAGYLKDNMLTPLTPELEQWCRARKITVTFTSLSGPKPPRKVVPYDEARGWYREPTHNLIFCFLSGETKCVGYLNHGELTPLTSGLEHRCRVNGIVVGEFMETKPAVSQGQSGTFSVRIGA